MAREDFREVAWRMLCIWTSAVSAINHTSYHSHSLSDIALTCREKLNFDVRSRLQCASTCMNSQNTPAGTRRNNNVFTTSTRRRVDVVKTLSLRHYCVMCPLGRTCQAFGHENRHGMCQLCLGIQCQGVVALQPSMAAMGLQFVQRDNAFLAEIVQGMYYYISKTLQWRH